jgi:hypothetical protein
MKKTAADVQPFTLAKLGVEAVLAIIALAGVIASSPLLVSKAHLIRERDAATKEADALRDAVGAFQVSLGVLDRLSAEVLEMRTVQIIATRYVVDLVTYIRAGGSAEGMPAIPAELRDDVLEALRDRAHDALRAATAVDAPKIGTIQ